MNFLTRHTRAQHAQVIAHYLPGGNVFGGKADSDTNLYKFLLGLAEQFRLVEENIDLTFDEYDLRTTVGFLEEWESALGIPDSCFSGTGTIAERQRDVNVKFLADTVVTDQDFVDIAALFGIVIVVTNGVDALDRFPFTFPVEFPNIKIARFTMFIDFVVTAANQFTFTFPIPFGTDEIAILECLFRKLAPANVDVIFRQV